MLVQKSLHVRPKVLEDDTKDPSSQGPPEPPMCPLLPNAETPNKYEVFNSTDVLLLLYCTAFWFWTVPASDKARKICACPEELSINLTCLSFLEQSWGGVAIFFVQ